MPVTTNKATGNMQVGCFIYEATLISHTAVLHTVKSMIYISVNEIPVI